MSRERKYLNHLFRERCKMIAARLPGDPQYYKQDVAHFWFSELQHRLSRVEMIPCACVGVHLHRILQPEGKDSDYGRFYSYSEGAHQTADLLGLTLAQLIDILHANGAPESPFGQCHWQTHPQEVFQACASMVSFVPQTPEDDYV